MPRPIIGIAWYDAPDFADMTALCADMRDETLEDWLEHAEAAWAKDAERMKLVRIDVRASKFESWCKSRRKMPLAAARREYVAEIAAKLARTENAAAKAAKSGPVGAPSAKAGWRKALGRA